MIGEHEIDKSFPYFEEYNFSGWLIQFRAMLRREYDCDEIIEIPIVKDVDANGNPSIPMIAREVLLPDNNIVRNEVPFPVSRIYLSV
jgi:hypothetical protein